MQAGLLYEGGNGYPSCPRRGTKSSKATLTTPVLWQGNRGVRCSGPGVTRDKLSWPLGEKAGDGAALPVRICRGWGGQDIAN